MRPGQLEREVRLEDLPCPLAISMAAFMVVPVISGWITLGMGGRGHFLDGFTPAVYFVTGLVLVWYTLETWPVRLAMVKQNESMVRQNELAQQQIQFAQQQADATVTPLLVTRSRR